MDCTCALSGELGPVNGTSLIWVCRYRSTLHRVINAGDSDRYSVPCFYHGDMKTKNPFKPNSADTETVKEHIRKKFDTSYGSSK